MQPRTCIGCRSPVDAGELVRLVLGPEGEVVVDLAGGAFGRGAWVHPRPDCISKALPAGLSRAFKTQVRDDASSVLATLRAAAHRRVQGLMQAARRTRKLEAGATAVEQAVQERRAALVLVASDARASAELGWLAPLIANGQALAFGSKDLFATWLGRSETALVAITDARIARHAQQAIHWTMLEGPRAPTTGARRTASSEAG
ncbi:MAG: DUF448 domain-containing protein [Polyangiaceae bacterium]